MQGTVVRSLWRDRNISVALGPSFRANDNGLHVEYSLWREGISSGRGCLVVSTLRHPPTRSRLGRMAQAIDCDEIIVFVALTARHVLVTRFESCRETLREACWQVYEIALQPLIPATKEK
jgi:hypothetical protein